MTELPINTSKGNTPAYALNCIVKATKMLTQPGLRQFLIIPILINFLLYTLTLVLGYFYVSDLITQFIPSWLEWLNWLIWPLFFISFFLISFFSFTLLANLMAAPFYSKLAAKTKMILSANPDTEMIESGFLTSIGSEAKRVLYLVLRALPLLVLFIIPIINLVAPILWMLFAAWSMALEYMAYPLENKGLLFPEQRQTAKSNRIGSLCFGGLVVFGLSIPVINIIVPPVAVIAATIYFQDVEQ